MIRGILFAVFSVALVAGIALAIVFGIKASDYSYSSKEHKHGIRKVLIMVCVSILLLALLIYIPGSFHQVDTGEVAVVRHLGTIKEVKAPGTYYNFYMTNKYETYDAKVQQRKVTTMAYSKDGQTMELEIFLQYQIQTENVTKIAAEYGNLDALHDRLETVAIEKTKAIMSSAEAMAIIQERADYGVQVSEAVRAGISADYYVNVKDVVLTNIDFTDAFEKAVEEKVIAEQQKQAAITKANEERDVAEVEKDKKRLQAEGDAAAKEAVAKGDAAAKIAIAEGEATVKETLAKAEAKAATRKIAELAASLGYTVVETEDEFTIDVTTGPGEANFKTLVEEYIQYLAYLDVWDGELPNVVAGDNALSIIVPNAA